MSVDFTKLSDKVYGLSGVPLLLLRALCSYINYNSRNKYLKSRWGWVCRSYEFLAFRCNCSRWAITQAVKKLSEVGLIRITKKGPHSYYNFGVSLDKLQEFVVEWTDEKKAMTNRETRAMDKTEDEYMQALDASDDEDLHDDGMVDPFPEDTAEAARA
jgi:hypothetical protein